MSTTDSTTPLTPIQWQGDQNGWLRLVDQTQLPTRVEWVACRNVETLWEAIKSLRVRGAPAIGISAAYGVCLGLQGYEHKSLAEFLARLDQVVQYLETSRPTAVNLFWALNRMRQTAQQAAKPTNSTSAAPSVSNPEELLDLLLAEARRIHAEDRAMCHAIGQHGAQLIHDGQGILTHCNAGGLATAEYGTALSVIFTAQDQGKAVHVFVDETRPLLQGARLTSWELMQRHIPCTLICDSMAAQVMREGRIQHVVTGADRIAANGDSANKIGTYGLAVLAQAHRIPFYIAAPSSTFDLDIADGSQIPIEERSAQEITHSFGQQTAPDGVQVYNPAFDVTPAHLIHSIITEKGTIHPVTREEIARVLQE